MMCLLRFHHFGLLHHFFFLFIIFLFTFSCVFLNTRLEFCVRFCHEFWIGYTQRVQFLCTAEVLLFFYSTKKNQESLLFLNNQPFLKIINLFLNNQHFFFNNQPSTLNRICVITCFAFFFGCNFWVVNFCCPGWFL